MLKSLIAACLSYLVCTAASSAQAAIGDPLTSVIPVTNIAESATSLIARDAAGDLPWRGRMEAPLR